MDRKVRMRRRTEDVIGRAEGQRLLESRGTHSDPRASLLLGSLEGCAFHRRLSVTFFLIRRSRILLFGPHDWSGYLGDDRARMHTARAHTRLALANGTDFVRASRPLRGPSLLPAIRV